MKTCSANAGFNVIEFIVNMFLKRNNLIFFKTPFHNKTLLLKESTFFNVHEC